MPMSIAVLTVVLEGGPVEVRAPRPPRSSSSKKSKIPYIIDLESLTKGRVPAHGFVVASKGFAGAAWGAKFFPWMRRLVGACAVASAIAMGLFVYTEFVQAWKVRGLPTIPITALSAIEQVSEMRSQSQPIRPIGERGSSRQQELSALDTYIG